jgi:hypothetical protein
MEELGKAHRQTELDNAKLQEMFLQKQPPPTKASPERASDERIEQLAAMVKELAGQVERLQDELKTLRTIHPDESPTKEVK